MAKFEVLKDVKFIKADGKILKENSKKGDVIEVDDKYINILISKPYLKFVIDKKEQKEEKDKKRGK